MLFYGAIFSVKSVLVFLLFIASSYSSLATVQNLNIGGVSFFDEITNSAWGSFSGTVNSRTDSTQVYNSCDDDPGSEAAFQGCNLNRVGANTVIVITFVETDDVGVNRLPTAYTRDAVGNVTSPFTLNNPGVVSGANQTITIAFDWEQVCARIGTINSEDKCSANGQFQIFVGVLGDDGATAQGEFSINFHIYTPEIADPVNTGILNPDGLPAAGAGTACEATGDGTGMNSIADYFGACDYEIAPGDEKVTVIKDSGSINGHGFFMTAPSIAVDGRGIGSDTNPPQANFNVNFSGFLVCADTRGFDFTYPWNSAVGCDILNFETPGSPDPDFIDDEVSPFDNGTTVYSRGATIDRINNVRSLFSSTIISQYCGGATTTITDPQDVLDCPFAATPQLVVGLISETKCFITTAIFGSPQAYQVQLFREFREKFLWTNSFGLFLSRSYNEYGPIAANWIYKNPWSKKFVRVGLYPAYWFAYGSLKLGFILTSLISLLLGLGLFVSIKRLVKIKS